MDFYESAVEQYVTRNGLAFVCPQYSLDQRNDFDFVALDYLADEILLIEVSASESPDALIAKAKNRTFLFSELWQHLSQIGVVGSHTNWTRMRFLGFIKDVHVKKAYEQCDAASPDLKGDLCFVGLEDVMLPYAYWDVRGRGLPVRDDQGWRSPERR